MDVAEELYGCQVRFSFTNKDVESAFEDMAEYYGLDYFDNGDGTYTINVTSDMTVTANVIDPVNVNNATIVNTQIDIHKLYGGVVPEIASRNHVMNIDTDMITEETTFVDDLGADSLDVFQIIMGIEEAFDIEISPEEAENITTVEEAVELIKAAVN